MTIGLFFDYLATNFYLKVTQTFRNVLGYFENRKVFKNKPHRPDLGD